MSSIIINTLIIILSISPFIYIYFSGKAKRKAKALFLKAAKEDGVHPEKTEFWNHGAMGLDKRNGYFCFQSELNGNSFHKVGLSSLKGCEVKKSFQTNAGSNPDLSQLTSVSLHLQLVDNKAMIVPIFDAEFDAQVSSELMIANDWQSLLKQHIG
ncbi:MAG TPA: hypothetical protein PLQ57_02980 [Saprospiraceae bacterium]|nr:hypothetical protein [Saprospiraceae bacterium]HRG19960.1 hypothetical protein [Saprospiraceae bacterium]